VRLGISSWTYPWSVGVSGYPPPDTPLTPTGLMERTRAFGLEVLQIADNLGLDKLSRSALKTLAAHARELGITLEAGTRGVEPERLRRYLEIAQTVGAHLVRTLTRSADSSPSLEQAIRWIGQVLAEYEAAGVVIAVENNESHTAREYSRLIREFSSPSLGVCLDTANSYGGEESTDQVVAELAPHAVCVHYKDFAISRLDHRMGFLVEGRPAGEGRVNATQVLEAVSRSGRGANIIVELWPPFAGTIGGSIAQETVWAERSVSFLKHRLDTIAAFPEVNLSP
jgi:3-oxoisoapionate decarboxylase